MKDDAAELQALAGQMMGSEEAEKLLFELATAILPPERQDLTHMTWPERVGPEQPELDAEARARAAERRFRTLVEQIPAVTFMAVLGQGKNEVYVSPHIEQMLGFTQKEWLDDPFLWYWQLHPDDRKMWNDEFARGCRTGGPFRAECRFLARDGREVWVHGEARIIRDEHGRPFLLQGVAFDITEAKQAQKVLLREAVRAAKHEEELAIAQKVQTSMVPRKFDVPGLEIAARMIPAAEVGGDYYDVLSAPDGCWLAIGDVSGHGLDAGLVMMMTQSSLSSLSRAMPDAGPSDLLRLLNDVLVNNIRERLGHRDHVTLSLIRYTRDGKLRFSGAHEEMLVYRGAERRVETVQTPGPWLGARGDVGRFFTDSTIELSDGDVLVLYTDGITEAMDARNRMFDLEGLTRAVLEVGERPVDEIRDHIIAQVNRFMASQKDDISLLVARYRAR